MGRGFLSTTMEGEAVLEDGLFPVADLRAGIWHVGEVRGAELAPRVRQTEFALSRRESHDIAGGDEKLNGGATPSFVPSWGERRSSLVQWGRGWSGIVPDDAGMRLVAGL